MYVYTVILKNDLFSRSRFFGQENCVNVGKNSSWSNSNSSKKLVQFLIILDSKSNVPGYNTALLVITSSISSKLENLSTEVLENSSKVYGCSSSDTACVLSLTEVPSDTTDRELKSCLCRWSGGLLLSTASFSFSCDWKSTNAALAKSNSHHGGVTSLDVAHYLPDMIIV